MGQESHMDRVYAVQRRSAYERVLYKIDYYQSWESICERQGSKMPEDNYDQLAHLLELRDCIRREMVAAGQIVEQAQRRAAN